MSNSEEMTDSRNVEESPGAEEASSEEAGRDGAPQEEIDLAGLFAAVLFLAHEPLPLSFFVKNLGVDAQQGVIDARSRHERWYHAEARRRRALLGRVAGGLGLF